MHSSETGSERLATTLIVGLVGDAELFVGADTAVTTDRDAVLPSRKLDYRTDPPIAWGFCGNEEWDTSFILLGSGLLGLGMFFGSQAAAPLAGYQDRRLRLLCAVRASAASPNASVPSVAGSGTGADGPNAYCTRSTVHALECWSIGSAWNHTDANPWPVIS